MASNNLIIILFTVFMSASAQILLKIGALQLHRERFTGVNYETLLAVFSALFNKYIFIGLVIYLFSAAMWIWVLTKVDISFAYPFISLSFIIIFAFGVTLFQEPLTNMKLLGTVIIMVGCVLITRA